jgi:hypothetical protein
MKRYPVNTIVKFQDFNAKVIGHATNADFNGNTMHIIERLDKEPFCFVGSVQIISLNISPSLLTETDKEITIKLDTSEAQRLYALLNFGNVNFDNKMYTANEKLRRALRDTFNKGAFGLGDEFENSVKPLFVKQ